MMTVEEFTYARARARLPVKVTLPSPMLLFLMWSDEHSRAAYSDPFELFADAAALMREEAQALADLGCQHIQVDAPDLGQLADPAQREDWESRGISAEAPSRRAPTCATRSPTSRASRSPCTCARATTAAAGSPPAVTSRSPGRCSRGWATTTASCSSTTTRARARSSRWPTCLTTRWWCSA